MQAQMDCAEYLKSIGLEMSCLNIPNKIGAYLSPVLVVKLKPTAQAIANIKALHAKKFEIFMKMEATDDPDELKLLAKEVVLLEFALQKEWGFPPDEDYHEWYKVPKCSCPKIENTSRAEYYRAYAPDCVIHGRKEVDDGEPCVI